MRLREVLGTKQAQTLMELLPPDRDQLATKADIRPRFDGLDQRFDGLDQRFDRLEQRFDGLEQRFDQRMERFEDQLWDFHVALRSQTRIFVTALVTAMLGVGSIVLAAAALI